MCCRRQAARPTLHLTAPAEGRCGFLPAQQEPKVCMYLVWFCTTSQAKPSIQKQMATGVGDEVLGGFRGQHRAALSPARKCFGALIMPRSSSFASLAPVAPCWPNMRCVWSGSALTGVVVMSDMQLFDASCLCWRRTHESSLVRVVRIS